MKSQAIRWIVAGSLLVSCQVAAQPLEDVRLRIAALRNHQPVRINVDVEHRHKGTAPLHLNSNKRRGKAVIKYGPRGVEMIERRWLGRSTRFSLWPKRNVETEIPLLSDVEARDLVDPAGMLELLLTDARLVKDERVAWDGQPARLLVVHPLQRGRDDESDQPWMLEARIWLDESGVPLAMERSVDLRIGGALSVTEEQSFTFQLVDGRLLADEVVETWSGRALKVLRSNDTRTLKVTSVE